MPAQQGTLAVGFTPVWRQSSAGFLLIGASTVSVSTGCWTTDKRDQALPGTLGLSSAFGDLEEAPSGAVWEQPVDDTVALADALTFDRGLTVADTVTTADALSSQAALLRDLADTLTLTDALAFGRDWHIDDTLSLADSPVTAAGKGASIDDTVSLADALTTQAVMARTIADTLSLADSLSSQAAFLRTIADTLTLADLADPVKSVGGVDHAQPIADTLAVADALSTQAALLRTLTDELAVADSFASSAALLRTIADTLTVSDLVVTAAEALMEGFAGMFDADTERGRVSQSEESGDYGLAAGGSSGSRTLTRRLSSVQSGKIDSE